MACACLVGRVDEAGGSGAGRVLLQTPGEGQQTPQAVQMLKRPCWVSEFLESLAPWPTSKAEAVVWPQDPSLTVSLLLLFFPVPAHTRARAHTHTHTHTHTPPIGFPRHGWIFSSSVPLLI